MGFIDFIFDNLFLFVIIISGIIGMLSGNKQEQKKQQERKNRPQQKQQPKPATRTAPQRETRAEAYRKQLEKEHEARRQPRAERQVYRSGEEEKQTQMEQLEKKLGIRSVETPEVDLTAVEYFDNQQAFKQVKHFSEEQEVLKNDLTRNLKNRGFINGIILAEVLGKPRALKPYQSVTIERYKK